MQSHDFKFTRRGDGKDYAMTSSDNMEQFVLGATRSWSSSFVESSFVEVRSGRVCWELSGKENPFPPNLTLLKLLRLGFWRPPGPPIMGEVQ